MGYIKSKQIIYVNSRNRKTGTDNDFEITVNLPSFQKFDRICILSAIIPKSYFNVQNGYNTFILKEDVQQVVITIPPANYNRRSLSGALIDLLNLHSPNNWTYNITYPNALIKGDDGRYTFEVSGNTAQPELIFDDNGVYELLGFNINSTNIFNNDVLTSSNVCKIQSEDVIRLHSSISDNNGDDVLLEIYSSSIQTFSNIVWNCPDIIAYSRNITSKSTNNYRFFLTNEDNQPLDLNGINICFTIIVYEAQQNLLRL